jgi:hypothetical protein
VAKRLSLKPIQLLSTDHSSQSLRLGLVQYVLISFVPCLSIIQTPLPIPRALLPRFSRNVTLIPVMPLLFSNQQIHPTKDAMPPSTLPMPHFLPVIETMIPLFPGTLCRYLRHCNQPQKPGRNATVLTFAPLFNLPIAIIVWISFSDNNLKVLSSGKELQGVRQGVSLMLTNCFTNGHSSHLTSFSSCLTRVVRSSISFAICRSSTSVWCT